jgi:cyclohexa-1,5-dienecarbonyl-CoA hydratase
VSVAELEIEERAGALRITLGRPPVNVLDIPTLRALHEALQPLGARPDLKALVLRSRLDGVFSAGMDVADHGRERVAGMLEAVHAVFRLLDTLPQVTLAAVDGRCLGGGCELAAFCDFVLATPRSSFGFPEIAVGCFPPVAVALLPPTLGRAAAELILTGDAVDAEEAARIGLVSRVVDDLDGALEALLGRLTRHSGAVLARARRALRQGGHGDFGEALARMERIYLEDLLSTEDVDEGVRAFLEKRPPRWRDR